MSRAKLCLAFFRRLFLGDDWRLTSVPLVAHRLEATCPQDCLAQPLQPEEEQERADDEPQRVDRQQPKRRAECGNQHCERHCRCRRADQG